MQDLQRLAQDVDVNAQLGYVFEAIKLTRSKLRGAHSDRTGVLAYLRCDEFSSPAT
jgi:hypothetical protein